MKTITICVKLKTTYITGIIRYGNKITYPLSGNILNLSLMCDDLADVGITIKDSDVLHISVTDLPELTQLTGDDDEDFSEDTILFTECKKNIKVGMKYPPKILGKRIAA